MVFSEVQRQYINACLVGDVKTVAHMIKIEGKNIKTTRMLTECLHNACEGGYYNIFLLISQHKPSVINCRTLYHACKGGNTDIVNKLTENFEDFDNTCYNDYSHAKYSNGFNFTGSRERLWTEAMYGACEGGKLNTFSLCINHVRLYKDLLFSCFYMACKSGNIELIHFITNRKVFKGQFWDRFCATKYNCDHGILNACASGSLEIIRLILHNIEDGEDGEDISNWCNLGNGLQKACNNGHIEIVKLMIAKGATNFDECIFDACVSESIEILNILIDNGATNWDRGLKGACYIGNMHFVQLMLEKGATALNQGLESACIEGHFEIIELMLEKGATNITKGFICACKFGRLDIVKLYVQNYAFNLNDGLCRACVEGYTDIAQFLIKCGATNLDTCLEENIYVDENIDIVNLLIKEGASPKSLEGTKYFRPYLLYHNFVKIEPDAEEYLTLLREYPPCVLFVGSRCSINYVRKLPVELFRLLTQYI